VPSVTEVIARLIYSNTLTLVQTFLAFVDAFEIILAS
jgi:hypothetical protein